MNIKLKNINTHRQYIPAISALYLEAFPESERAPFGKLLRRAKKPNVSFFACLDGDIWAGFVYVVNYRDMSYIFYLAIDEKLRGRVRDGGAESAYEKIQRQAAVPCGRGAGHSC